MKKHIEDVKQMEIGDIVNVHPVCQKSWKGKVTEIAEHDKGSPFRQPMITVTSINSDFTIPTSESYLTYKNGEWHTKNYPPDIQKRICKIKKQIKDAKFICSENGCESCLNNIECNKLLEQYSIILQEARDRNVCPYSLKKEIDHI